jgi:hypothetical protein
LGPGSTGGCTALCPRGRRGYIRYTKWYT